jgi:hypothetical protein
MRTPDEIKKKFLRLSTTEQFEAFVKEIQTEAWNEAIEAVQGLPHTTSATGHSCIYSDDIEKLKK